MSKQEPKSRAEQDPYAAQRELSAQQESTRAAIQSQQSKVEQNKMNPGFYREIADPHADSEMFNWVENEFGVRSAPGFILGNRDEEHVFERQLLNRNHADRMIAEREPGRILKKNPGVLAMFQGLDGEGCVSVDDKTNEITIDPTTHPEFVAPIERQNHRRQIRDFADLQTQRESLAVDGRGLDALTKATTETVHRNEEEQESDSVGRFSKFLSR